jgi:hypothetical protein
VDITDEKLFHFWNSLPHGYRKALITQTMTMIMHACERGNRDLVTSAVVAGFFEIVPTLVEKKNGS